MSRLIRILQARRAGFIAAFAAVLLPACQPRVATSFWRIGTPADSVRPGYAVLTEGKKVRHCYPVTEWTDTVNLKSEIKNQKSPDTYHSFHHHGVAVESEYMAYRIYFDKKQTIDPYCKRTPQLELAQSYWYPNDSLLAEGYGDDILRVSGTVGVGSVKYWNGKLCHIENLAQRRQRILRRTRNSATIEVADIGWQVPMSNSPQGGLTAKRSYSEAVVQQSGQCIDLIVQYTIKSGHRDMRCDVSVSEPIEGLCTGVQLIPNKGIDNWWLQDSLTATAGLQRQRSYSDSGLTGEAGRCSYIEQLPNGVLLATWGTDWPVNDSVKFAKETVGLAVFIPKKYAGELIHDKSNNLCLLNLTASKASGPSAQQSYSEAGLERQRSYSDSGLTAKRSEMCAAHFYLTCCGATKENHPVATSATEWLTYLRRWASKLR